MLPFQDSKLKITAVVLPVHERASRNCAWVSLVWQNYLRALVRPPVHLQPNASWSRNEPRRTTGWEGMRTNLERNED